jgi:hypothetical protein
MLTGNASDKTPRPSEVTIRAWMKYFGNYPKWSGDDLVAAANEYCKRPRERMVQPADLGEIIRLFYADAIERMNPDDRGSAWEDLGGGGYPRDDGERVYRDIHGVPDKGRIDPPPFPPDWDTDQRLRAYWDEVRSGVERPGRVTDEQPGPGAGYGEAPDEHEPGEECVDPNCDQPSTFGAYCARHYVLSFQLAKAAAL